MAIEEWANLQGTTVFDTTGQTVGEVDQVFFDQKTSEPSWVTVRTGRSGAKESFVPLDGSRLGAAGLAVAVGKDAVEHAPAVEIGTQLSEDDAGALGDYYSRVRREASAGRTASQQTAPQAPPQATPQSASQPQDYGSQQRVYGDQAYGEGDYREYGDDGYPKHGEEHPSARHRAGQGDTGSAGEGSPGQSDAVELTRFEEQVRVSSEPIDSGVVRLHKYVVTEHVDTEVPVRHEEVRVEHVPVSEVGRAADGHRFAEESVEVTLHEERPSVDKEVVPVETVRLTAETHTEQRRVSDDIRRERIEVEDLREALARR